MKIAFVLSGFPVLSETFILNQIVSLMDMGNDVEIFAQFKLDKKEKFHKELEEYNLMKLTHYLSEIPYCKVKRFVEAVRRIVMLRKHSLKIVRSLNFFKYGKKAISLRLFFLLTHFIENDFDVIHAHFGPNGNLVIDLKEIGIRAKYVTSFHGFDVNKLPNLHGKGMYRKLFRLGDRFIANTQFIKDQLINLGCNADKISVIPVGVNLEKFKRHKPELNGRHINILTVGRLVEEKGYEYAIRAIARLVKTYKDVRYVIAGYGPLENELKALVKKLAVENYVEFAGAVDQDEIIDLYHQSQIFILSSVKAENGGIEGQGLVIQEAQLMGIPVVASRIGGIPDGLLDGRSGFLVEERDEIALAERIEFLIQNPQRRLQMGEEGKRFVKENYDIRKLNERLDGLYQWN